MLRAANVKIKKKGKLKWIHVSRCKLFKDGGQIPTNSSVVVQAASEEQLDASFEPIEQEVSDAAGIESPQGAELEPDEQEVTPLNQRRYPLRDRRAKKYKDYVLSMHHRCF